MVEDRHLIIANAYPDDLNIYNYGFLHRRVKNYLTSGLSVDVFRIDTNESGLRTYIFDGVMVTTGNRDDYEQYISTSTHASFLIHFPLEYIVAPIRRHRSSTPIIAWLHGYEALSWHRRWYDKVDSPVFMDRVKSLRTNVENYRVPFLRGLYRAKDLDIRFVTVSDWFLKHNVEPDAGIRVANISVIPNVVDAKVFPYVAKSPEMRFRVLVVKPFTAQKYANDLVVKTILAYRSSPNFDKVQFTIRGDGPMFDEILEPLRGLENVDIAKSFLRQDEIARLHHDHGVFLSPTRWDSQGVSIGEAMSSGLVPVSTAISAIPEFVAHGESGLLAGPEDPEGLAACLEQLVGSPETFSRLSEQAARHSQEKCGTHATTDREIQLIQDSNLGRTEEEGDVAWDVAYADLQDELFSVFQYFSDRLAALDVPDSGQTPTST
ncbi:glycosyltransferase family 4 protein [Pseudarthrobacter sp. PvP090]|uniref:glycosyltransferase family 4 protein n=1 Tax=Pseudarthrobacter sp. PvP090 TaxID=3156393 RepID=UPI003391A1CF